MADNTVKLHRVFVSTPEKIYRAFIALQFLAALVEPEIPDA